LPGDDLGKKIGRLAGHDQAGFGNRLNLFNSSWVKDKGDVVLAIQDRLNSIFGPAGVSDQLFIIQPFLIKTKQFHKNQTGQYGHIDIAQSFGQLVTEQTCDGVGFLNQQVKGLGVFG